MLLANITAPSPEPLNQLDFPLAIWQKINAGASFSHEQEEIPAAYLRISHTP